MKEAKINLSLGFTEEIPEKIPCHAYALGIIEDYKVGEIINNIVNNHTEDWKLLEILKQEIEALGYSFKETSERKSIIGKRRVVWITRMYREHGGILCRDYHLRVFGENGEIYEKYVGKSPQICSNELIEGEYSLGIYALEKAP